MSLPFPLQLFKKAKAKGYGEYDIAAVYRAADLWTAAACHFAWFDMKPGSYKRSVWTALLSWIADCLRDWKPLERNLLREDHFIFNCLNGWFEEEKSNHRDLHHEQSAVWVARRSALWQLHSISRAVNVSRFF